MLNLLKILLLLGMSLPTWVMGKDAALWHGPVHEAIERLDKKIRLYPDSAALYLQRGQFHAKDDNFHAAYCDYHIARKLRPDWSATDLMKARLFSQFDYLALALHHADIYLQKQPDDVRGLATRAEIHTLMSNDDAAVSDFERLLTLAKHPKPQYYINISNAILRVDSSDYRRATEWLDKGETKLGFNIVLKSRRIDLEVEREGYESALREVDDILARFARKEKWLVRKAEILEKMGCLQDAYDHYNQAFVAIQGLPRKHRSTDASIRLEGMATEGLIRLQQQVGH